MNLVDLHTHSTASDGTDSPAALVRLAKEAGLRAVALTDHDTTAGLDEALAEGERAGVMVVPGCELSTSTNLGEVHILGLWVPRSRRPLEEFLLRQRNARKRRNAAIIARLRALGIDLTLEEAATGAGGSVGRPHIAAALVARGCAQNVCEAFDKFLGRGGAAWAPRENPSPEEACRVLAEVGATAVLAHPFLQKRPPEWVDALTGRLVPYGLGALEAWHSGHDSEYERIAMEIAGKHGLPLSGGSDYHGKNKPGIAIGRGYGNLAVPEEALLLLLARRRARGLPC